VYSCEYLLRTREEIITNWKELTNTTNITKFREDLSSRPAQAKKFSRSHLNEKKLGMVVHSCHPAMAGKIQGGRKRGRKGEKEGGGGGVEREGGGGGEGKEKNTTILGISIFVEAS
jgi:hypothetical protein